MSGGQPGAQPIQNGEHLTPHINIGGNVYTPGTAQGLKRWMMGHNAQIPASVQKEMGMNNFEQTFMPGLDMSKQTVMVPNGQQHNDQSVVSMAVGASNTSCTIM